MRYLTISLLVLALFLGGYLATQWLLPARTGEVMVQSTPPGAEVWIDLVSTKQVTPARLKVPVGQHSVTVKMPGYRSDPFMDLADVSTGMSSTVSFVLVADEKGESGGTITPPARTPPSTLSIEERIKKEEPWSVPRKAPSSVDSTFPRRTGQEQNQSDKVDFSLQEDRREVSEIPRDLPSVKRSTDSLFADGGDKGNGQAEISSSVNGAAIILNDKPTGKKTPSTIELPLGTHTVRVELSGYKTDPEQHIVRISRAAASQFVFFQMTAEEKARMEFTVKTEPVEGEIFVDGKSVGVGQVTVPHNFGVFEVTFGAVEGYHTPEMMRVVATPANSSPTITANYRRTLHVSAVCNDDKSTEREGDIRWEAGVYDKDRGTRVSEAHGPKVAAIPGSHRAGWELAMGDPNKNPTGADYIEFLFTLPEGVSETEPLNLRLYLYRSQRKYPLSLSSRCEITVTVNGRVFLDAYRPRHDESDADAGRFEEWSLQHTLVPGENRIVIRTGEKNQLFTYLWKIEVL
jgi:hypothetical protein